MKQLISWIILLLFLTNIGGFFYVFKIKEYAIKKEIKTKIKKDVPKDELCTFIITDANSHKFEWEHSKEFRFNGMMYDVVYKTVNDDGTTTLECVSDVQETQLFKDLNNYLVKEITNQNNGKHPLVEFHNFLNNLIFIPDVTCIYPNEVISNSVIMELPQYYTNPFIQGIYTPPQI